MNNEKTKDGLVALAGEVPLLLAKTSRKCYHILFVYLSICNSIVLYWKSQI